jgi:hypothetical protein
MVWKLYQQEVILGLTYYRYRHEFLPLTAEKEEGDKYFMIYVSDDTFEDVLFTDNYCVKDLGNSFFKLIKKFIIQNNIKSKDELISRILALKNPPYL